MWDLFRRRGFTPYVAMLFLNAFVDLGHKIVIQNTVFKIFDGTTQSALIAVVNAMILLPFILLFSPAGHAANRYPKPRVMQIAAWAAVVVTLLITFCYAQGWFRAAFALTLILAAKSAFYSPAKYGYIREVGGTDNIAAGNGVVAQMQGATLNTRNNERYGDNVGANASPGSSVSQANGYTALNNAGTVALPPGPPARRRKSCCPTAPATW